MKQILANSLWDTENIHLLSPLGIFLFKLMNILSYPIDNQPIFV